MVKIPDKKHSRCCNMHNSVHNNRMEFSWDETKRLKNIKKHRLDFIDAPGVFDGPLLRFQRTGLITANHVLIPWGFSD